jgi:hypothetical protein
MLLISRLQVETSRTIRSTTQATRSCRCDGPYDLCDDGFVPVLEKDLADGDDDLLVVWADLWREGGDGLECFEERAFKMNERVRVKVVLQRPESTVSASSAGVGEQRGGPCTRG